jgi:lysine 2,3-aminomutase
MAGSKNSDFSEKLTPYLKRKLEEYGNEFGLESEQYKALQKQYVKSPKEKEIKHEERLRHYQSEVHVHYKGKPLRGVERLYRRTILLEPTMVCAAHCRWCLRGQYPVFSLTEDEITNAAKYCGSDEVRDDLKEMLITGGDAFMVPKHLELIFSEIKKYAPNIEIIRIGTRVPVQEPSRVNDELINVLKSAAPIRLEIGTNINHPAELTIEARKAYTDLYKVAFKIYDQTVLLKGVNDNIDILNKLYDVFRYLGIESHYLFHCIPMQGMSHHRTSVQRGLEIASQITNSGSVSGRAKPMFTLMTDIGKITLYHGTVLERNMNNEILIQSHYTVEDFKYRNPSWQLPRSAFVDGNGFLRVWYPDGSDDDSNQVSTLGKRDIDHYFSIPINRIN